MNRFYTATIHFAIAAMITGAMLGCGGENAVGELKIEAPAADGAKAADAPEKAAPKTAEAKAKPAPKPASKPAPKPAAEPKYEELQSWAFNKATEAEALWSFPPNKVTFNDSDVTFYARESRAVLTLNTVGINAADIRAVEVEMTVRDTEIGKPAEFVPEFYWARDSDVRSAKGDWPFSTERGIKFAATKKPNVWRVNLEDAENWNGKIERLFIGLKVKKREDFTYKVIANRFSLLK